MRVNSVGPLRLSLSDRQSSAVQRTETGHRPCQRRVVHRITSINESDGFFGRDRRFPSIAKSWRSNWTNIIPFFSYPPAIRKVIYTTNAIESIQAQLRKVTRNRGAFPSPEAVRKILYLAIERISKRWKRPIRDWVAALNHFSVVFEGRVPE